jgi:predicted PurR-regulated permease PerM
MTSPSANPTTSHRQRFVLLMLSGLLLVFLYMISDLLIGVIAALLLWVITADLFERWTARLRGRRSLGAGLTILTVIVLVLAPIGIIVFMMISDAATLAERAQAWLTPHQGEIEARLKEITSSGSLYIFDYELHVGDLTTKLQESVGKIGQFLLMLIQGTIGNLARAVLLLFVTLYALYYLYLDGANFLTWLKRVLPLSPAQTDGLLADFFNTSKATLKAVLVIGVVQGTLGGLAFWICGIPAPFFWTVLMAVASIIPAVGAQIILLPAAGILILIGSTGWGIGLLIWSLVVVANVDNLLRPKLVKRDVNLHELLIFLSSIGGIATFGFFGFLAGPVIAALLKASFVMYSEIYRTDKIT